MDATGSAASRRLTIGTLAVAVLLFGLPWWCCAQQVSVASSPAAGATLEIRRLFEEQRWQDVVREVGSVSVADPDLDYYYGSALGQLGRWDDARRAFLRGRRLAPRDKRFPIELAGVSFKQKRYASAATWLRRALDIDPRDFYANDFLGTIYFLEGNLEAALEYWNCVGKPQIDSVQTDPTLRIRPALLDRALAFSPADTLQVPALLASQVRTAGLGVFPTTRFQLAARPEEKFDVVLNFQERNGFGSNRWEALLSTFSGAAYQTIYPAYFNIARSAVNVTSLVRWDAQKRRVEGELSGPLRQNPKWRYRIDVDLRNENWDIRESFTGPSPSLGSLNLRRQAGGAQIDSFNSGRWGWSAGIDISHRDFRSVIAGSTLPLDSLLPGAQLKQHSAIHFDLLRLPDHRFVINSIGGYELGRIWSQPAQVFSKLRGSLAAHWLPRPEGDDFDTLIQVRGGDTEGKVPFDELYMLGMERDNDLWMRAHVGTRDGRKGSAPLGRRYFLTNSEVDKNVYSNGLITVKLGPFLDSGKITDPSGALGASTWLWDTGAQAKLRVLGVGFTFIYGKDLRTGNNALYFTTGR